MKSSVMLHFIWVITVCKSTLSRVYRIQKVKDKTYKLTEMGLLYIDYALFAKKRNKTANLLKCK